MQCADNLQQLVCFTNAGGVKTTLLAHYTYAGTATQPTVGALVRTVYTDAAGATINTAGGTVVLGACPIQGADVFRIVQPLVAGNNVITHNLGFSPAEVEVRNNTSGAEIAVRVIAETATTVTIFTPVAVASARISIDV